MLLVSYATVTDLYWAGSATTIPNQARFSSVATWNQKMWDLQSEDIASETPIRSSLLRVHPSNHGFPSFLPHTIDEIGNQT